MNIVKNSNGTITINSTHYGLYKDTINGTHILIAGQTGAGKSTVLDGLIYTIITSGSASDYQLILVDAKRVALNRWKSLPHTIMYASEPSDIERAFDKALSIADSRYKEMDRLGLRQCTKSHIYFVIDEMADLMLGSKSVKTKLQRLIQIGRASNIHLICGTQTFLSSVVPTPIKTNFTNILCLRTRNASDSRTILGFKGAELLPPFRYENGQGDLIYLAPHYNCITQFKVYTDSEIEEAINQWKLVW